MSTTFLKNFKIILKINYKKYICIKKGDTVPSKTLYYNYGSDFLIFDEIGEEEDNIIIHYIKDNKVEKTFYLKDFDELNKSDFEKMQIISYYGKRLNIKNVTKIYNYKKEFEEKMNRIEDSYKNTTFTINELVKNRHTLNILNKKSFYGDKSKYFKDIIANDEIIKEKDKEKYKTLEDIYNDKEILDKLIDFYENKHSLLKKEFNKVKSIEEPLVKKSK